MSENTPQPGQGQPQQPQGYGNYGYQNSQNQYYGQDGVQQPAAPQNNYPNQQPADPMGQPAPNAQQQPYVQNQPPYQQNPQQGYVPQQGYPAGDPNAGFAQPQQAPAAPAAPNPFVESLKGVWNGFLDVFKSQPGEAHQRLQAHQPWGWIIAVAAQSFVVSLFLTQMTGALLGIAYFFRSSLYSRGSTPQGASFGQSVLIFLIFFIALCAIHVLRGLQLMLTARIGKVQASFNDSMSVVGVAALPLVASYLLLYLFVLLMWSSNGRSFAGNPMLMVYILVAILAFSIVISETLIYLGLNRLGRFEKSPVIMHALLTTAWVLVALIVYNVAFQMLPNP